MVRVVSLHSRRNGHGSYGSMKIITGKPPDETTALVSERPRKPRRGHKRGKMMDLSRRGSHA